MPSHSNPLPATIGRFQVEALLGIGGMGEVYRAIDPTLQRTVAIKVVRPDIDRPDFLERLYREAQACARLQHPHIVTVYEAGEIGGVVYIAMEFLKGEDLAAALRHAELPFDAKIRILVQVLEALAHAHANDVIHRDIKPSNVYRQSDGSIKLVDFGLARDVRAQALTVSGTVMGTPNYASPEQLKGLQVDSRTDIYSTGVVAYEMFTGRRPFQNDEDSVATVVLKVISEPAPPMDVFWTRAFPEIERIVTRAMAKSPEDRYQSADEMRQALAAFLSSSHAAILAAQAQVDGAERFADASTVPLERSNPMAGPTPVSTVRSERPGVAPAVDQVSARPSSVDRAAPATARQTLPPSVSGSVPPAPGRSRTVWWVAAALAAILVAAVVILPQLRTQAPDRPGDPGERPPSTNQTAGPTASVPAEAPASEPAAANQTSPATREPGTSGIAVVSPATNASDIGAKSSGPAPAGPTTPPPAIATAKQLFFGDGKTAPSGAPAQGDSTGQMLNTGLRYRLIQQARDGAENEVDPLTEFHTGDKVRFAFESNINGHLYVAQLGTSGRWTVLFPNPEINGGRNAIKRLEQYQVPDNGWFVLEDPPGTEQVFVFLSLEPLNQLPGFNRPVTELESVRASVVEDLQQRIQSRDLVFQKDRSSTSGGKPGMVTYVVNRAEVGKAVAASFQLKHGQ